MIRPLRTSLVLWRARPTTALMVTHDLREAARPTDRVLVFGERPTTVVGAVDLPVPREERTDADIDGVVARLRAIASSCGDLSTM